MKKIFMTGGFSEIAKLLEKEPLETIIESLPDPIGFFLELIKSFPQGGYEFDADALFQKLRKQAEEEGLELLELLKQTEIPFVSDIPAEMLGLEDVLPETLGDLIDLGNNSKSKYKIVGEDEANLKENKLAVTSPLARCLIGKEEGDIVELKMPEKTIEYEIIKVKYV